jgi:hypothetical protein
LDYLNGVISHNVQRRPRGARLRLKCDGARAETRFRLSAKRTSPFKSAGASVPSTTGSRGARISGSNAGYTMFQSSVRGTGYQLHSSVSLSLPLPLRHRVSSRFNRTLTQDILIFGLLNGHTALSVCRCIPSKWKNTENREARKTWKGPVIGYVKALFKMTSRRGDEHHVISPSNGRRLTTQLGRQDENTTLSLSRKNSTLKMWTPRL